MQVYRARSNQGVPARIAGIATYVPQQVLTNEALASDFPTWPADKIYEKTGIRERRIAAPNETALDLGLAAARKLIDSGGASADDIDFVILCTQAPDYILPTSACLVQDRLGLGTNVGALDINLGCSGFVYGLALASGLIASGAASNVLLITADTYSKYINPKDKSVRTLFGDGAAATLITAADEGDNVAIGPFIFGSDGAHAGDLIVEAGGFRLPSSAETAVETTDSSDNIRSRDNLYMDGAGVLTFTLREVPRTFRALLEKTGTTAADYDQVVFHQANRFILDALRKKLALPVEQVPYLFEMTGNTVSSTIPFVLADQMAKGACSKGRRFMLVGFGVGLSWAAASIEF